jgi:hypothetical protein
VTFANDVVTRSASTKRQLDSGTNSGIGSIKIPTQVKPDPAVTAHGVQSGIGSDSIIHARYGHICKRLLRELRATLESDSATTHLLDDAIKHMGEHSCDACNVSKMHKLPFSGKYNLHIKAPNDKADGDVIGPFWCVSVQQNGNVIHVKKYISVITDVFSRRVNIRIIDSKSQVSQHVLDYSHSSERETGNKLKCFHCDNAKEYNYAVMLLTNRGVKCTRTPAYTSERNPIAEKKNRTLEEMMRTFMSRAHLPRKIFWQFAMEAAAYVHNRVTVVKGSGKTQHELFTGLEPHLSELRVFGCNAVVLIDAKDSKRGSKIEDRGQQGIFVGYDGIRDCYKILLKDGTVKSSVHVIFDEYKFTTDREHWNKQAESADELHSIDDGDDDDSDDDDIDMSPDAVDTKTMNKIALLEDKGAIDRSSQFASNPRRSNRVRTYTKQTGLNLDDFGTVSLNAGIQSKIITPLPNTVIYARDVTIPKSRKEAIKSPYWAYFKAAEESEMQSFKDHGVYTVVDNPGNVNVVGSRFVYDVKTEGDRVVRFKARLVAQGFSQIYGRDYTETFSGTVKSRSIRITMGLVAMKNYVLETMDVGTAYLNADLHETIYMTQPTGYESGGPNKVWLLKKAVYGLRQAGREWNVDLNGFIVNQLGFTRLISDPCMYFKISKKGNIILLSTYVDDIPSAYSPDDINEWNDIKIQFDAKYKIKFLGESGWLLNMRITRVKDKQQIYLDQESYVNEILEQFKMDQCAPVSTPSAKTRMSLLDCPTTDSQKELMMKIPYRGAVGSLMYLSNSTRPDIAFAVRTAAQFCNNPGMIHWQAVKQIFRYLRGTANYGLKYQGSPTSGTSNEFTLIGYADADWAGCLDTRKSTTGGVITMGHNNNVVDWLCNKQKTQALSSCEAEYMATGATLQSMMAVQSCLQELGLRGTGETMVLKIRNDNQSAIAICKNDVLHNRVRHIDIRHHFIRDHVNNKTVELQWIPTRDQIADILTKPLQGAAFQRCRDVIVYPVPLI